MRDDCVLCANGHGCELSLQTVPTVMCAIDRYYSTRYIQIYIYIYSVIEYTYNIINNSLCSD